jgi:hypothetical protein
MPSGASTVNRKNSDSNYGRDRLKAELQKQKNPAQNRSEYRPAAAGRNLNHIPCHSKKLVFTSPLFTLPIEMHRVIILAITEKSDNGEGS